MGLEIDGRELVDLVQPLSSDTRGHPVHGDVEMWVDHPFGPDRPRGCHISVTRALIGMHHGTHVDAPRHFFPNGLAIDQYPLDRFVRPAVTVGLEHDGATSVMRDDLAPHLAELRPGDFLLLSFGYARRYGTPAYEHHPYLDIGAAALIVERGASALGVDLMTPDAPLHARRPDFDWPVHRTLLGNDVLIFENLGRGLERIVGRRLLVSAAPLPVSSGDGSLLAPYAVLA